MAGLPETGDSVDVLVVGAGPTGLVLAAQLLACGVRFRIVDRQPDRVHESRALAIQPRTLEALAGLGITDTLLARGNRAVELCMHAPDRVVPVRLFDIGIADTAYPFLLFLSQAETEQVLIDHLAAAGVEVERGVELLNAEDRRDHVTCLLRRDDGTTRRVDAHYLVGCDGPHSSVRRDAHIEFRGETYPQTFLFGDVEADGALEPGATHVFVSERGLLFFFPLGSPATWRVFGMRPRTSGADEDDRADGATPVDLADLQDLADDHTGATVRLNDPVWLTEFQLHRRQADRYRAGHMFLAGDAAHVHSPTGAQGMNTGIGDACNLGWKLALVARGIASELLLDSYEIERQPVGDAVVRLTDRAFSVATSTRWLPAFARTRIAPRVAPLALHLPRVRRHAFRALSQLAIDYRDTYAVTEGEPRLRRGPMAGDRLPDADLTRDGDPVRLHEALADPVFHLLLCGAPHDWPEQEPARIGDTYRDVLTVHHLSPHPAPGALHDPDGRALRLLGITRAGHYLVRPDGHIAHRGAGTDLAGLRRYLTRWLPGVGLAGARYTSR